ncbi:MAG: 50S ribosomal protein L9 [Gammaproteobacteria bacterium]
MEVILLEKVRNLGQLGDKVRVKPGYGRNYLIPQSKAVPANARNLADFEAKRAELEKAAEAQLKAAQARAEKLEGLRLSIQSRAADEGKLYGSVTSHDIVKAIKDKGFEAVRAEIEMPLGPIRQLGEYTIRMQLHTDVEANIIVTVEAEA